MKVLLLALLALGACTQAPAAPPADPAAPPFPLLRFFEGRTEGRGILKIVLRSPQSIHVQSRGRVESDGTLVLVQDIDQQGKPRRTRHWQMREVAPGRFEGALTDATGPVKGEVSGNRFHVAFPMKGGVQAEQWLTLRPNGRTVDNVMHVRKLGVTVATLRETIQKID